MTPIRWLTSEDVMERYNVSRQTFHRWRRNNQLPPPHSKPGTKPQWREDLLDAFDGGTAPAAPASPAELISICDMAARLKVNEIQLWQQIDAGLVPKPVTLDATATRRTVCAALNISEQTCLSMEQAGELPDFSEGTIAGFDPGIIGRWESLGRPAVAKMQDVAAVAARLRPLLIEAMKKLEAQDALVDWLRAYGSAPNATEKMILARQLFVSTGMAVPTDAELQMLGSLLN